VLYSDGPLRPAARLRFTVDGGAPRVTAGALAQGCTRGARALPVSTRLLPGALHLQRRARVFASPPLFIPIADDATAGTHLVSIAVTGAGSRVFARFFSYGTSAPHEVTTYYARRDTGALSP
jgi:hypothetical protein